MFIDGIEAPRPTPFEEGAEWFWRLKLYLNSAPSSNGAGGVLLLDL
jgi:hypothetical protein